MEEIKIQKDRIIKAARECSEVEDVLRILFPEVFEQSIAKYRNDYEYEEGSQFVIRDDNATTGTCPPIVIDASTFKGTKPEITINKSYIVDTRYYDKEMIITFKPTE